MIICGFLNVFIRFCQQIAYRERNIHPHIVGGITHYIFTCGAMSIDKRLVIVKENILNPAVRRFALVVNLKFYNVRIPDLFVILYAMHGRKSKTQPCGICIYRVTHIGCVFGCSARQLYMLPIRFPSHNYVPAEQFHCRGSYLRILNKYKWYILFQYRLTQQSKPHNYDLLLASDYRCNYHRKANKYKQYILSLYTSDQLPLQHSYDHPRKDVM